MRPYIILLLLLIDCSLFGQVPQKDTINKFKKLKIALVTGSSIVLQEGIINTEESKSFMTFYNDNGQPVEERIASLKEKSAIVYKYEYGKCGDYQKWEWLQVKDGNIDTVQMQQIMFDENCRMKKILWKDSTGKLTGIRYFDYDNKGRQKKEVDKDTGEKSTSFVIYSYPDSLTVEKKGFFGDSTFWYHSKEYFDFKGNRIGSVSYDESGNKSSDEQKAQFIYNGDRLSQEITYNPEGKAISKSTYYYNTDNLVDRIVTSSLDGGLDMETITIYKYRKKN